MIFRISVKGGTNDSREQRNADQINNDRSGPENLSGVERDRAREVGESVRGIIKIPRLKAEYRREFKHLDYSKELDKT